MNYRGLVASTSGVGLPENGNRYVDERESTDCVGNTG